MTESFSDFKDSFSYRSRTDLNWKFLAKLDAERAAEALAGFLEIAGRVGDSGDPAPLVAELARLQAEAYGKDPVPDRYRYGDAPFASLKRPLAEARVGLMTSSGHFVEDPRPFGVDAMTQEEAIERIGEFLREAPDLSEIPVDVPVHDLQVRHGGYDIAGAVADRNVAFPVDRLREMAGAGEFGELHPVAWSFVGAASQVRMAKEVAPQWARLVAKAGIDVLLLVPV